jgi:hypothetical protein
MPHIYRPGAMPVEERAVSGNPGSNFGNGTSTRL